MVQKIKHKFLSGFPAFKHRNYRIFFSAQIISLVGTWMQTVAQGYLAYQLTDSAFWVGIVTAMNHLPATGLSLIGGTLLDRFHKKDVLQITQSLQFIIATILGIVVITDHINLISLMAFSFLLGIVKAIDQPARISIIKDLVSDDNLHSATAMNMSMMNSARIIGPAIAGILIATLGVGWAFLLNGLSFLPPFLAYNFIKFKPFVKKPHFGTIHAIKEGLKYATTHPTIKFLLTYLISISIFGWAYTTILPVTSVEVFKLDASGLGTLYAAAGAGSVFGALVISAWARKFNKSKLILAGGLIFSLSLLLFSLTNNLYLAIPLLFLSGLGLTTQNSTIQAIIQGRVDDHYRGRVASIQTLILAGLHPIGSIQIGFMAEHFGSQIAIGLGAAIILICSITLFLKGPKID